MANERTFLAWMRTSLNCITLGIAIVKLLDPSTLVKITGLFFIIQGLCTVVYPSCFLLLSLAYGVFNALRNNAPKIRKIALIELRYGMVRYRAVTFHVEHGQYPVDATGPMVFMGTAVVGGVLALAISIGVVVT